VNALAGEPPKRIPSTPRSKPAPGDPYQGASRGRPAARDDALNGEGPLLQGVSVACRQESRLICGSHGHVHRPGSRSAGRDHLDRGCGGRRAWSCADGAEVHLGRAVEPLAGDPDPIPACEGTHRRFHRPDGEIRKVEEGSLLGGHAAAAHDRDRGRPFGPGWSHGLDSRRRLDADSIGRSRPEEDRGSGDKAGSADCHHGAACRRAPGRGDTVQGDRLLVGEPPCNLQPGRRVLEEDRSDPCSPGRSPPGDPTLPACREVLERTPTDRDRGPRDEAPPGDRHHGAALGRPSSGLEGIHLDHHHLGRKARASIPTPVRAPVRAGGAAIPAPGGAVSRAYPGVVDRPAVGQVPAAVEDRLRSAVNAKERDLAALAGSRNRSDPPQTANRPPLRVPTRCPAQCHGPHVTRKVSWLSTLALFRPTG
jgi:hypothetical protein